MDDLKFGCPHCRARLSASRDPLGTDIKCSACGGVVAFRLPNSRKPSPPRPPVLAHAPQEHSMEGIAVTESRQCGDVNASEGIKDAPDTTRPTSRARPAARWISAGLAALALAAYVAWPYSCAYRLQSAMRDRDERAISSLVDFPSLGRSVSEQLRTAVHDEIRRDPRAAGNPLAPLVVLAIDAVANSIVTDFMTPAGFLRWTGHGPGLVWPPEDARSGRDAEPDPMETIREGSFATPTRFEVRRRNGLTLVFRLRDWSWRLCECKFPSDILTQAVRQEAKESLTQ